VINIDTLGQYESLILQQDNVDLFQDDDELVLMQIKMDTDDRQQTKIASKKHLSKHCNYKSMLCP